MRSADLVELKNGSQELSAFVSVAMFSLENLIKEQPILFYELVSVCRDRKHVFFGNAGQALKKMDLLQSNSLPHDSLRNVVLSTVIGEGCEMKLTSPFK